MTMYRNVQVLIVRDDVGYDVGYKLVIFNRWRCTSRSGVRDFLLT